MTPVLLIAANFLREQRWLTLVLVLYAAGGAAVFGLSGQKVSPDDLIFFLHQQALYSVLFSFFLAVSAINNEHKSRRILAVLSKAITRRQYLAGLLGGILAVFGIYSLTLGVGGTWMVLSTGADLGQLWTIIGVTVIVSLLVSSLALFFTTFLTPVFATAATALSLGIAAVLEHALGHGWKYLLPVYSLAMQVSGSTPGRPVSLDWWLVLIAAAETLVLWVLASWIFARRDITIAAA